jgi:hypothetical protein
MFSKVKLSLCFNWPPRHEGVLGSRGIAPRILDCGSTWRWLVSFTPQPLYPQGKSPCYPLDRELCRTQSRSGRGGQEKNSQPLSGLEPPIIQPVAQSYTTELLGKGVICDLYTWHNGITAAHYHQSTNFSSGPHSFVWIIALKSLCGHNPEHLFLNEPRVITIGTSLRSREVPGLIRGSEAGYSVLGGSWFFSVVQKKNAGIVPQNNPLGLSSASTSFHLSHLSSIQRYIVMFLRKCLYSIN